MYSLKAYYNTLFGKMLAMQKYAYELAGCVLIIVRGEKDITTVLFL